MYNFLRDGVLSAPISYSAYIEEDWIYMANPFAKGRKYMMPSSDKEAEDNVNPKVQTAQAAKAKRQRHQKIQHQTAVIIGSRNQLEMQLGRLTSERDKITEGTRQTLAGADQACVEGDEATAQKTGSTAEVFTAQLINVEKKLGNTMQFHQQAVSTAEEAQRQAQQSQVRHEQTRQDTRKLESQTNQVKMWETASETLRNMQGIPEDPNVSTLDSVREKIEGRYANALDVQELTESSQVGRTAEVETSTHSAAAGMRLAEIHVQMNNESAALESDSVAKNGAGELESVESAESAKAVEDTITDADETK